MIIKFLLSLLIFTIVLTLSVFNIPTITTSIEKMIWLNWFTEFILKFKSTYDETVTNIPTKGELENTYNTVQSWALDFKDKFEDWIKLTKQKIDSIRGSVWEIEDTYNDLKDNYDEVQEFIDTNSWKIDEIKEVIETITDVADTLTNTWETN